MSIDAVDSNPTPPPEKVQDTIKSEVLRSSLPHVTAKIGRLIRPTEVKSMGYVLEKGWNNTEPLNLQSFVGDVLGLKDGIVGHVAEKTIYDKVYQTLQDDYQVRLIAAEGDLSEKDRLTSLWAMVEDGKRYANEAFGKGDVEIHLGGVPEHWLSSWVKSFDK